MKKLGAAALCAVVFTMTGAVLAGCGSTTATTAAAQPAARVIDFPFWVGVGSIWTEELKNMPEAYRPWRGDIEEDGILFSGEGKSEREAFASAVASLDLNTADSSDLVRIVDKYIAEDGTVYILIFISDTDIKKLEKDTNMPK